MSFSSSRSQRLAGFSLIWTGVILLGFITGILREFEEPLWDMQQRWVASPYATSAPLAMVAIDQIPPDRPWPWPRLDYALLLRGIAPHSPQSVIFEMTLNDRDTQYSAFDQSFATTLERFDRVLFASVLWQQRESPSARLNFPEILLKGDRARLLNYTMALGPLETFAKAYPTAPTNLLPDSGNRVRRVPLLFLYQNKAVPSLSLQAFALLIGADWRFSETILGEKVVLRNSQKQWLRSVPIDDEGFYRPRFRLTPDSLPQFSFDNTVLSAEQILRGEKPEHDLELLRRKQVWVCLTVSLGKTVLQTPLGPQAPGVIQWQAVRAMWDEDALQVWPWIYVSAVAFSIAFMISAAFAWKGFLWGIVAVVMAQGFVFILSLSLLHYGNILAPLGTWTLLIWGVFIGALVVFCDEKLAKQSF